MSTVSWTNIDGEWCVKIQDSGYHTAMMVGMPYTVTSAAGKKKRVVLGECVRHYRVKGGRWVDVFKVEREIPA